MTGGRPAARAIRRLACALLFGLLAATAHAQEDDLEVPSAKANAPAPASAKVEAGATAADVAALRGKLRELEEHLARLEAAQKPAPPAPLSLPSVLRSTAVRPDSGVVLEPVGLVFTGFLQTQYLGSQLSEDQLQQGGTPLNKDGFQLRLARLRLDGSWQWARLAVELSGNTLNGAYAGVLRAEASFLWRQPKPERPPYVMVTGGLQEIPFGYELPEGTRRRPFMERTLGSQALFPGITDLGLRVSGGVSFFRYALAAMNGVPFVDRAGASYAVTLREKDLLGRVGVDTARPGGRFAFSGGASFLVGTGFHPGTDATVGGVTWRDTNENSLIDAGELLAVPPRAATPSETFGRWAVNVDAQLRLRTRIGLSQLYGEVTLASNLDRGYQRADPIVSGYDVRQIAAYLAVTQQLWQWALVGFRWDYYDPNADFTDARRGQQIPTSAAVHTFSPLVGVYGWDHLRLYFQYDAVIDKLGRDPRGVPVDLANNQWTVRLQGGF